MNYVFISPHFPSNFKNFAVGLKKAGVHVFGIASEPYELLDTDLRESLTSISASMIWKIMMKCCARWLT